jgi:flagellar L-ring protein precursor FlgH
MRTALLLAALVALGGCQRLSELGRAPRLADMDNPADTMRQVSMPMPATQAPPATAASLWRPGSRTFLRDQRASQVGDLITVLVSISDEAELQNRTQREREGTDTMGAPRLGGIESSYLRFFPNVVDPSTFIQTNGAQNSNGSGSVRRNESVTLRVAATITQVLANGNMVLAGRQQVRVNSELRDLTVSGVIRAADIGSDNTVRHDRLAEARISYGGRGTISDMQQPRIGQQLLDIILPF